MGSWINRIERTRDFNGGDYHLHRETAKHVNLEFVLPGPTILMREFDSRTSKEAEALPDLIKTSRMVPEGIEPSRLL